MWLGGIPVAVLNGASQDPEVLYVFSDHLGAPSVMIDKNNGGRWRWISEPFGTTTAEEAPGGLAPVALNLRFPGQYFDKESGLSYNYFRDYDGTIGRYVQSDPIGLTGGMNTYAYVEGNPLSFADPNGLQAATAGNLTATLPAVGGACVATGGTACAAAVVGVVGVGSYWLTDRYVNPWAQPMIASAIDWCAAAASDTPTKEECDAEWLTARNICVELMDELGRPGLTRGRRKQIMDQTGGSLGRCIPGHVAQACGGTRIDKPPKRKPKSYL